MQMTENKVARNDGGAAFPSPTANPIQDGQLSVRDYFAAHAPKRAWNHFHPVMPPRPEAEWGDIEPEARWDVSPLNWQEIEDWKAEQRRQFELQWPYAYADAMLTERAK